MSIIQLKSGRKEENNYLKLLTKADGSESKTYVLKVSTPNITVETRGNKYVSITPFTSEPIVVGSPIEETELIVKSIDFTLGYGYTITVE